MAYTEFYCQNGGSNLNAGSTNNNTAAYTSIHGNWVSATGVFTPTDGSTPASSVNVGDWASVYIDGASVGVYIGRISAVGAGVNGAITANTTGVGSKPANQTGTATIKVGGAWQGPNGASGFPFTLQSWGLNKDASAHIVRTNLKNDQTYSLTASFAMTTANTWSVIQGYSASVNDGGRATFDGGTSTGTIISDVGASGTSFVDIIFKTSITTGTADLMTPTRISHFLRCVFTGSRQKGVLVVLGSMLSECEAYDNNKANSASTGAFHSSGGGAVFTRCIAHDNTGSNTSGFFTAGEPTALIECISDTNGKYGLGVTGTSVNGQLLIKACNFYNNTSDGINIATGHVNNVWIENCNFVKNGGAGINNVSIVNWGFVYNCGYGSGTQANGSGDTINNLSQSGTITYGSNLTPWVDPANGDFRVNLAAANFAGRATFTQTASSYAGTVGYPDIGAAQSLTGSGGTFFKEVSSGYSS